MSKKFDAVAWMRQRREMIDQEDQGLSWEERTRKTTSLLRKNPFWNRLKNRRVKAESASLSRVLRGKN